MSDPIDTPIILLVEDDEVLRQVVSRELAREGYSVLAAGSVQEALQIADGQPLRLALLDLTLPDGNAADLGRQLRERQPKLPMLLMTGNSARLQEHPELSTQFQKVMIKPVNLKELRRAVRTALTEGSVTERSPAASAHATVIQPTTAAEKRGHARDHKAWMRSAAIVVFAALVLLAFVVYALQLPIPGISGGEAEHKTVDAEKPPKVELVADKAHTIEVPDDVLDSLGIRKGNADAVEPARVPQTMRSLSLSGSTALNPNTLIRIKANFAPAKVVRIEQIKDESAGTTIYRDLRSGDRVNKGQILAEFTSLDVASRKSDLVDALIQLSLDQEILRKAETASSLPEIVVDSDRKQVRLDQSTISRAERQLHALGIPPQDIDKVYEDARQLCEQASQAGGKGPFRLNEKVLLTLRTVGVPDAVVGKLKALKKKEFSEQGEFLETLKSCLEKSELERWQTIIAMHASMRDPDIEKEWATVRITAPLDGFIVERNVNPNETIVDNTINLFQIDARDEKEPEKLLVVANADERDVPKLLEFRNQATKQKPAWTIVTLGDSPLRGIHAFIDDIGSITDPNQHTVPVKGLIDNPDRRLRGGQHVTALIQLPPPRDVVEIPVSAIVDDGKQTLVLVQSETDRNQFTLRRVQVTHWFDNTAFVKSAFTTKEQQALAKDWNDQGKKEGLYPIEPLQKYEKILTTGVLLLKKELQDREPGVP